MNLLEIREETMAAGGGLEPTVRVFIFVGDVPRRICGSKVNKLFLTFRIFRGKKFCQLQNIVHPTCS